MYKIKQIPEDFIVEEIGLPELVNSGNVLVAFMRKRNMTTDEAISILASKFEIRNKEIQYAGNKDKDAVTYQFISIKNIRRKLNEEIKFGKNLSVTPKGYLDKPLFIGAHQQNKFTLTIRNLISELAMRPVPNYFDNQRFSKSNVKAGLAILKKDFKTACSLLDVEAYENDYVGALRSLPMRILRLIVYAVQSYLYNELLSDAIKKSGVDYSESKYSEGSMLMPKEWPNIPDELPLIGFGTEGYDDLLAKFDLTTRDFIVRAIPEISAEGSFRKTRIDLTELKIGKLESDELNQGMKKSVVSFILGKGSYATVVIRALTQKI